MAKLFDVVELITDISETSVKMGYRGTVVECYPNELYEVEFPSEDEDGLNLLTLSAHKFIIVWQAETRTWVSLEEQVIMKQLKQLHEKALNIANMTAIPKLVKDSTQTAQLFNSVFELEKLSNELRISLQNS
jgi:hypothetical protein